MTIQHVPQKRVGEPVNIVAPKNASILIVDDEFSIRDSLYNWFRKDGYEVTAAANAAEALAAMQDRRYAVVLLDVKMPGMDGMELQEHIQRIDPQAAVIMITAFASVDTAVRALKQGAFDYLAKPINPDELSHVVLRALEQRRLAEENTQLRGTIDKMIAREQMIGQSPGMQKVLELIDHVAQTDSTVLILGESGTGKELVARAIHAGSKRRYFPLVPVNCGAFPEQLLESELFGHEKGAFTGAEHLRRGKIEMADGGTLFLDEVGAIAPRMQVDLLRILETKELTRVGGMRSVKVDFRVISATNDNLLSAIMEGRFREDFYYRLNVFTIELPPLRARRTDIPLLARHFLDRFARQMDKRITEFCPEAMNLLAGYDWPGNVRELCNAVERAVVVGHAPAIRAKDLPLGRLPASATPPAQSLEEVEKRHIAAVLAHTRGNIKRAAEILKIDRVTVYNKIKKYGLRM